MTRQTPEEEKEPTQVDLLIGTIHDRTGLNKDFLKRVFDEADLKKIKSRTKSNFITGVISIFGAGGALTPVLDHFTGNGPTLSTVWLATSVFSGGGSLMWAHFRHSANRSVAGALSANAHYNKNYRPKMLRAPEANTPKPTKLNND